MAFNDLGFEKQDAGSNLDTWGVPHLNNTIDRIRYAISGYLSIAITGDTTLTSSNTWSTQADFQSKNALLKFTGTLANNATITLPGVAMSWMMYNATNKTLTFTTGAGTTANVETGDTIPLFCDGTNVRTLNYGGLALKDFIAASVLAATGTLPSLTGNAGKFLYTDAVNAFWRQPSTADLSDYSALVLGVQVALAVTL